MERHLLFLSRGLKSPTRHLIGPERRGRESHLDRRHAVGGPGAIFTLLFALFLTSCAPHDHPPRQLPSTLREPVAGIELVRIDPGTFMMGSEAHEGGRNRDEAQHRVDIEHPFMLGRFEVTQSEWESLVAPNPSHHKNCRSCPVENVTRQEIDLFIEALNARHVGWRFRLPTEAEWEYACRAGTSTPFHYGDSLTTDQANFDGRFPYPGTPATEFSIGETVPVGSYPANAWGLHDLHGNVWERLSDLYGPYPDNHLLQDYHGASAELGVIRGGGFLFDANSARCALRYTHEPHDIGPSLGFRVAADRRPSTD